MRIVRNILTSATLLIFALACTTLAFAQDYQIVRAEYGADSRFVDVTQKLRQIASNSSTFRMGNSTFGVDPAPGVVKTLRILARSQNGGTRTFEYREGSTVDGSQFSGWNGGNWGNGENNNGNWNNVGNNSGNGNNNGSGQYQIQHAKYGTERNNVDVTQRLRELATNNSSFRMGNSTFGVDPDPGTVKILRIYAISANGQNRIFEFREGSTVDGSQFSSWNGGNWGNGNWNGGWGGGPGWGSGDNNGNWNNGSNGNNSNNDGGFQILHARYGTERHNVDVTRRLRRIAASKNTFRMGNSTFGVDPDHGVVKTLRIYVRNSSGRNQIIEYREGSTVDGSQFSGWDNNNWGRDRWNGDWNSDSRGGDSWEVQPR